MTVLGERMSPNLFSGSVSTSWVLSTLEIYFTGSVIITDSEKDNSTYKKSHDSIRIHLRKKKGEEKLTMSE